jgi:hypothetical protein
MCTVVFSRLWRMLRLCWRPGQLMESLLGCYSTESVDVRRNHQIWSWKAELVLEYPVSTTSFYLDECIIFSFPCSERGAE